MVLDCTLRDGGYVNNWDFGFNNISAIIKNLSDSHLNFIECGYLKDAVYNSDKAIFSDISQLLTLIPKNSTSMYTLMINYGEYPIEKFTDSQINNIYIRVAFKKKDLLPALKYCRELSDKGYNIIINPMHTNLYSDDEINSLIDKVNEINPYSLFIVDTIGCMQTNDVTRLFSAYNDRLLSKISIGFHSHNNLQLSFSNSLELIKLTAERNLIIDSTVFGMGRGAGNIRTEHLTKYINDLFGQKYNIIPILKTINDYIEPIYKKNPWGYSLPYYFAAVNQCHPDYAKYLSEKSIKIEDINNILQQIPIEQRSSFNMSLIDDICKNFVC